MHFFFDKANILDPLATASLWLLIGLPYIAFSSVVMYLLGNLIKKRNVLFSIPLIIIYIILFSVAPYSEGPYYRTGVLGAIFFFAMFTAPFIPIVAILFTLIPYLILRYREKKYNLVVKNPPYTKNKFLLIFSILGICIYVTLVVASIKLVFYILNGY